MPRALKIVLPIVILAACGAGAWIFVETRKEPERRRPPEVPLRVDAVRLKKETYPVTVKTRGTVRPRTESTLIPEVSGTIIEVSLSFREGEFFEKGDVLLTIDPLNYRTAVTVAKSSLAQMKVVLEEEKARAEQAIENWKQLGGESEPGDLVLRKPQVAEAEARIAAAEAELERAARDLERTTVRAPYAGRILEQNVDVGQYVTPGTVLAQIYAVDYVEIRLPLTNDHLAFVDLPEKYRGDPNGDERNYPDVTLAGNIGGKTHTWHGRVVRVEGAIDQRSRQLFVVAQVDNPYAHHEDGTPPLKIGLFVEARITGNTLDDVFVLPRSAVRADSEVILIDAENRLQRHAIDPLVSDESVLVVSAGEDSPLQEGQLLCVTPLSFAANGISVLPVVEGEAPPEESLTGAGRPPRKGGGPPPGGAGKPAPPSPPDPAT